MKETENLKAEMIYVDILNEMERIGNDAPQCGPCIEPPRLNNSSKFKRGGLDRGSALFVGSSEE